MYIYMYILFVVLNTKQINKNRQLESTASSAVVTPLPRRHFGEGHHLPWENPRKNDGNMEEPILNIEYKPYVYGGTY